MQQFPNVTNKMIDEWKEKENEMRSLPLETQTTHFILHPGPEKKYKELYQFMLQTFKDLRAENKAVTTDFLLELAEKEEPQLEELTIKGKRSLINRFMKFNGLSVKEITGYSGSKPEDLPEDQQALITEFYQKFEEIIQRKNIPVSNIFNMDQTAVYYENPTSKTIEVVGTREVCAYTTYTRWRETKSDIILSIKRQRRIISSIVGFKGNAGWKNPQRSRRL